MLFGCDQIVDRSLGHISKTKNNDSTLTNKESSLKSSDSSSEEIITKKLPISKKIYAGRFVINLFIKQSNVRGGIIVRYNTCKL